MLFNENVLYLIIVVFLLIFVDLIFFIISLYSKKNSIDYKIENISKLLAKGKTGKADILIKEIEEEKIIEKYKAELLYKKILSCHLSNNQIDKNKCFNDFIEYIDINDIKIDIKDRTVENLLRILDEEQKNQIDKYLL